MQINNVSNRKCTFCKKEKQSQAFVGYREMCRSCWLDIPASEKHLHILNEQQMLANRRLRDKRKAKKLLLDL